MIRNVNNYYLFSLIKSNPNHQYNLSRRRFSFKKPLLLGFTIFIFTLMYNKREPKQLQFITQKTKLNQKIIKQNKYFNRQQYVPTFYLSFAGWMQLLYAEYVQTHKFLKLHEQKIGSSTVYQIPLHNQLDKDSKKHSCVVVIGGSQKLNQTMSRLMHHISSNRLETIGVVVQDVHDHKQLENVVNELKKSRKGSIFHAVGLQYGANLLVKACAYNPTLFQSIVSIGNPLDLQTAQKRVSESFWANRTYGPKLLKGRIQSKNIQKKQELNLYSMDRLLYNIESDEKLRELKGRNSSINYLSKIKVPTLLLNSLQDEFSIQFSSSDKSTQLQNIINENAFIMTILSEKGGHNHWFYSLNAYRWMPSAITAHLKIIDQIYNQQPQPIKSQ